MEPRNCDPYEQRLLSVYESCLEKGESQLGEQGLKILCEKLQLEERGIELISNLLEQTPAKYTITFEEFRNGLVNLLDESCENDDNDDSLPENKVIDDSSTMSTLKYEEPTILSPNYRKLRQFCIGNSNGDINMLIMNGDTLNHVDESDKQMLGQIFQKLDVDCDGLISFNEFMLLFQDTRCHEDSSIEAEWKDTSSNESACKKIHFNMLGPDHSGYIDSPSVINLWQMAGVTDAKALLNDLNFNAAYINLSDLVHVLNEELKSLQHEPKASAITKTHLDLLRATLSVYQEEVRSINSLIDQLSKERDKLKIDVSEANERANILAAEIDENHAKLEKSRLEQIKILEFKHAESIRDLTLQHSCERDAQMATLKLLNEQLQTSQHEEQQIRSKLADALNDNQTLEADNQNLSDQISKLKMSNNQLLMQVQMLAAECDEAEASDNRENEQVISLVDRIKGLQAECALLRDQNDELTSELELLKSRTGENKMKLTITSFSDSEESNSVTDCEPLAQQVGLQGCEKSNQEINEKKISNIPQTLASIISDLKMLTVDKKICTLDCELRRNISEIINELEIQDKGISKGAAEKLEKSEENGEEECEERMSESLRDFVVNKNDKSRILMMSSHNNDVVNNLDIFNSRNKTSQLRDYPPRKGDSQSEIKVENKINISNIDCDVTDSPHDSNDADIEVIRKDRDRLSMLLQEQEIKHNNEKKLLQEQCKKMEGDLESLRNEYYQCEDYWAGKLEEERQIMEQEQKVTDDKLAELISKIAEYEEQFSAGDKSRVDGRLSPIEEKYSLEQQYTDLEEEFNQFRKQTEESIAVKDQQLTELNEKLKEYNKNKVDCGVQVLLEDNRSRRLAYQPNPLNSVGFNYVLPNDLGCLNHVGQFGNQKIYERGKLDKIAEHSISDNEVLYMPSKISVHNCCCQQSDPHSSTDQFSKMHKLELQRLLQKRAQCNLKCTSLMKQKEYLMKEIMDLQNFRNNHFYPNVNGSNIDINCVKGLMAKVQMLEEKKRNLQVSLKHLKHHTDKIIQYTWKQHSTEVASLQHVLKETQDSLAQQVQMNTVNMEKLAKSDLLLKDLYIENTYLKAKVDCLGERCHMLINIDSKSTSV